MLTPVIENIIVKYLNREASTSEMEALEVWLIDKAHLEIFKSYVKTKYLIDANILKFNTDSSKKQLLSLISEETKVIKMRIYYRVASYAAVVVLFIAVGFLFKDGLFYSSDPETETQTEVVESDIKTGTDRATLTLEDGSDVILNKNRSYKSAYADSDGKALVYSTDNDNSRENFYNVLTIPRGGQFFIQLADGTKVWLNSESQLKYPVAFADGHMRQVELLYGEAYFEVSPSTSHNGDAFKVQLPLQTVEVLGTQFNIKAYQDESETYTTLIEGKVLVSNDKENRVLVPGQQSIVSSDTKMTVKKADVNLEIAWKQGLFSFKDKSLKEIMIVLSRWYDVDISFENKDLEKMRFKGVLSKKQRLEDILSTIENMKVINGYDIHEEQILIK